MTRVAVIIGGIVVVLLQGGCGRQCDEVRTEVDTFCTPGSGAPAGQSLTLMARESCGGCGDSTPSCVVAVTGSTVTLEVTNTFCEPPPFAVCTAVCRQAEIACEVPALAAGDYAVALNGQSQPLHVEAASGATSCTLTAQ